MDSLAIGEISPFNTRFKWVIDAFIEQLVISESIVSPVFTVMVCGGTKYECQLDLQLDSLVHGEFTQNDYLSIYLYNVGVTRLTADVSFSILDSRSHVVKNVKIRKSHLKPYPSLSSCAGAAKFAKLDFVRNKANGVLNNEKLTILCEVILETCIENITERNEAEAKEIQLFKEFQSLIDDEEFSDVSFTVDGKTLRAHKCILVKRSSVFAAMFRTEMKEKRQSTVDIKDISHGVFMEMLRYVYSGKVNGIDTVASELVAAAEKYSLDGLKAMCEGSLLKKLCLNSVLDSLNLADRYRMDTLKTKAVAFIVSHAPTIVNKPEFQQLHKDVICEVCRAMASRVQ